MTAETMSGFSPRLVRPPVFEAGAPEGADIPEISFDDQPGVDAPVVEQSVPASPSTEAFRQRLNARRNGTQNPHMPEGTAVAAESREDSDAATPKAENIADNTPRTNAKLDTGISAKDRMRTNWNGTSERNRGVILGTVVTAGVIGLGLLSNQIVEGGGGLPKGAQADKQITVTDDILNKAFPTEGSQILVFDSKEPVRSTFTTNENNEVHLVGEGGLAQLASATIFEKNGQEWYVFNRDGSDLNPNERLLQGPMSDGIVMINVNEAAKVAEDNPSDPVAFKLVANPNGTDHQNTLLDNGIFVDSATHKADAVPVITNRADYIRENVGQYSLKSQMDASRP